jgi:D-psicose/D-tagatose/L-ribulose 3-epimerase
MRYGVCCGPQEAEAALEAGFDYVELPANQLFSNLELYQRLRPEVTNLFFPPDVRLIGPGKTDYLSYARDLVHAAHGAGVQVMVIGSGAARRVPEDYEPQEAEGAFLRVVAEINELAEPLGITIAPESLNRGETNVGNDLCALASELQTLGIGYTADAYHVMVEWSFSGRETDPTIEHWRDQIPNLPSHVHVANSHREDPEGEDPALLPFVHRLFELGYDGRISLESRRRGTQGYREALSDLRALFAHH